jgi:hypothetical protein
MKNRFRNYRPTMTRLAIGAGCLGALAGLLAFRQLTTRSGEAALSLVPGNALLVGTLDL